VWEQERCVGDIHQEMPDVTIGAISLQLKALLGAGLVDVRPDRQQRYYRARRERLASVAPMLEQMWVDALWSLKLAAELEETRRGPRRAVTRQRRKKKQP
jgi:DNA-binding transcriptional ArsR family regulator